MLHTFVSGSTVVLTHWVATIGPVSPTSTYLNFLASHDGIGMRPAEGLLSGEQCQALIDRVLANGGLASMKTHADGSQDVYELNISHLDALTSPIRLGRMACAASALAATTSARSSSWLHPRDLLPLPVRLAGRRSSGRRDGHSAANQSRPPR